MAVLALATRTPAVRPPRATATVIAPARPWPLPVPFFSQLELGDQKGWNNCLQACARSLLGYNGIGFDQLVYRQFCDLVRDGIQDGDHWENSYTDYPWLRHVVREWFGLGCTVMTDWPAVLACLETRRQPAIILLKNRLLAPRQYPQGQGWDASHFITLNGFDAERFYVCDPLAWWQRAPAAYTRESVEAAVAPIGVYALALNN